MRSRRQFLGTALGSLIYSLTSQVFSAETQPFNQQHLNNPAVAKCAECHTLQCATCEETRPFLPTSVISRSPRVGGARSPIEGDLLICRKYKQCMVYVPSSGWVTMANSAQPLLPKTP